MAGGLPEETEYDLSDYTIIGGEFTFEPWAIGSGTVTTILPPPLYGTVYLKTIDGENRLFTAKIVRRQYNHKTGLYVSELKDAVSAVYKNGVEFESETDDDILSEIAEGAGIYYSRGTPAS